MTYEASAGRFYEWHEHFIRVNNGEMWVSAASTGLGVATAATIWFPPAAIVLAVASGITGVTGAGMSVGTRIHRSTIASSETKIVKNARNEEEEMCVSNKNWLRRVKIADAAGNFNDVSEALGNAEDRETTIPLLRAMRLVTAETMFSATLFGASAKLRRCAE